MKYCQPTPQDRYLAWRTYKEMVDKEVERLESAFKIETDPKEKEECRNVLNEMYKTQFHLEHDLI